MSDRSAIQWTESTWNPVRGCTKVSTGCKHCYAETFAERFRGVKGHPYEQGFDVRLVPEALNLPLHWRKPRRVFVNSMSDLFHEDVPEAFIDQVFSVMVRAPQHTFQVLTKRAGRMRRYLEECQRGADDVGGHFPWANIWVGVSCEDQAAAEERIPHLLATPAAVRFISAEPLLGAIDLVPFLAQRPGGNRPFPGGASAHSEVDGLRGLDWIIIGGESGPRARPCDVAWIRSLVEQCRAANVPAFCKQLGAHVEDRNDAGFEGSDVKSWPISIWEDGRIEDDASDTGYQGAPVRVRLLDRKGGDPSEWPADLRVREWPLGTP